MFIKEPYLIDYLKDSNVLSSDILGTIKTELDQHIYYYGEQFKYPVEKHPHSSVAELKELLRFGRSAVRSLRCSEKKPYISSNAYFSFNSELERAGYDVRSQIWNAPHSIESIVPALNSRRMKKILSVSDFKYLISSGFADSVKSYRSLISEYYANSGCEALIAPNDMAFFENVNIKAFRETGRPTFVFLHGLPGRYNDINDNQSDYLIVWGEKIKQLYVQAGVEAKKIFVSGHPNYKGYTKQDPRFSFDDILVITKSMAGAQPDSKNHLLSDRGNLVLYLHSVQKALIAIGVKSARVRLHPSENPKWYLKFIDNDFYSIDVQNLRLSLERSSLVIGPTSTVMLEAVCFGVNYLVYEPTFRGLDLTNAALVPPFDGSDDRIPVAKEEQALIELLQKKKKMDTSFLVDYIKTPFDVGFIKDLISAKARSRK